MQYFFKNMNGGAELESNQLNDLLDRVREVESILRNSDYVDRKSHQKLIDELHDIQKKWLNLIRTMQ
ncbi:hypothetical protein Alsa4_CDS0064 [Staphylococcus phage Alsa_4]|nr:hypothetical protein Alsa4_CDS0064 [Staphylococcus phage Alsa_4]